MSKAGKGHKRRPCFISQDQLDKRWRKALEQTHKNKSPVKGVKNIKDIPRNKG